MTLCRCGEALNNGRCLPCGRAPEHCVCTARSKMTARMMLTATVVVSYNPNEAARSDVVTWIQNTLVRESVKDAELALRVVGVRAKL